VPNRTGPPDPESRSPATCEDHGAPKQDGLASAIENTNTLATRNIQERVCPQCGNAFWPRNGSGGKAQKYCSAECRHAFHANEKPNVGQRAQRTALQTLALATGISPAQKAPDANADGDDYDEDDSPEFDWSKDNVVLVEQLKTAIYRNADDSLVLRQYSWPDDDQVIIITAASIDRFLDRLLDICGIQSYPPKSRR
jgi:hypothetical protein